MRLLLSTALSAIAFPKRHRPSVGADEKRDLVAAAASGDARAAIKLLSMGCHPDSTSETPTGPVSALRRGQQVRPAISVAEGWTATTSIPRASSSLSTV